MNDNLTIFGTNYTSVTGIKAKGTSNGTLTYIRPDGTKSITENGTGIDVTEYAAVDVAVESELYDKYVQPTLDNQIITPSEGKDGFSNVTVYGFKLRTQYKTVTPSTSEQRITTDRTAIQTCVSTGGENASESFPTGTSLVEGQLYVIDGTVTYLESQRSYTEPIASKLFVWNGTEKSIDLTVSIGTKFFTATITANSISTATANIDYRGSTITLYQTSYHGLNKVIVKPIPSQYIIPSGTKSITENGTGIDVASYASVDVAVPSSGGTPSLQSKSATPTESAQTVTPDSGYDGLSSVSVGAISSTYVGTGITRRSSSDLWASGRSVIVPAGYYSAQAQSSIAFGTEGTPTATKSSVSNHSVSVTPSVTNTAGYIAGGTLTGTAVSISASELVNGTYAVNSSGTKDVTNYASATVPSGGATASATKGTVSNHSVTVTPRVTCTAGWVSAGTSNGTAVTVSASELVSGSTTITDNGTTDVTNLASVTVALDFVTYHTSSTAPTSSQGSDGDIWLVTS